MNEIVFAACAIAVAASVQGLSGFGFGMVAMGLLPLILPVTEAVPIVALLGVCVSSAVLVASRRSIRWRVVLPVGIGSLIGVPLGVWFLVDTDPGVVKAALGAVLVVFALHGLFAREPAFATATAGGAERWRDGVGVAAAVLGGALGGAFNVGGPPLIVYVAWRRLAPDVLKATLQCCFVPASCLQLALFVHHGVVTRETLVTAAAGLPAIGIGLAVGLVAGRRVSPVVFRRIVLSLLLVLGAFFLFG